MFFFISVQGSTALDVKRTILLLEIQNVDFIFTINFCFCNKTDKKNDFYKTKFEANNELVHLNEQKTLIYIVKLVYLKYIVDNT